MGIKLGLVTRDQMAAIMALGIDPDVNIAEVAAKLAYGASRDHSRLYYYVIDPVHRRIRCLNHYFYIPAELCAKPIDRKLEEIKMRLMSSMGKVVTFGFDGCKFICFTGTDAERRCEEIAPHDVAGTQLRTLVMQLVQQVKSGEVEEDLLDAVSCMADISESD